jgi:clan AA aspartic protease (TIGR02281 family)
LLELLLRRLAALWLLFVLAGCEQGSGCDLVKVTQVPLEPKGRVFAVPVAVNGRMISMVLDTGAKTNMLTDAATERLGVVRDGRTATIVTGVTGGSLRADARLDSMSLGGVPLSVDRISVNSYPGFDGVLGLDSLKEFDLDIDAPNRVLTLYRVRTCESADPPWSEPAVSIAGVSTRMGWLAIPIEINGVVVTAVVDTGASSTMITPALARRLGLTEQALGDDRILKLHVIAGEDAQARVHRFQTMQIGPLTLHDVPVIVLAKEPPALGGGRYFSEAVIGQNVLSHRRIWFSFATDRLFVTDDAPAGEPSTPGN